MGECTLRAFERAVCTSVAVSCIQFIDGVYPALPPTTDVMVQSLTPYYSKIILSKIRVSLDMPLDLRFDLEAPFSTDPGGLLHRVVSFLAEQDIEVPSLEMEYWPVNTGWTMYGLNEKQRLDEIRTVSRHVSSLLGIVIEDSLHDTVCELCMFRRPEA